MSHSRGLAASFREARLEFRGPTLYAVIGCLICQMGLGLTYVKGGLSADLIGALDLTRAQFSGANTPQLVLQSLASPVVGYLTIRFGASRVLGLSALLFAAVFFYFSRVESVIGLYIAVAGVGLAAAGMGDITVGHAVTQAVRKNRGLALGIAYAGSNLGGSLMVILTGSVAAAFGWRAGLMAVVPVALFILLPAAVFLVREQPRALGLGRSDAAEPNAPADDEDQALPSLDLSQALRTRTFWVLTATLFTFFFFFAGILDHFVLFLTDVGLSKQEARGYLSQAIALGVLSKVAGGFLADRIPHERAILYVYIVFAFSSLVLLMLPNPILLPVFVFSYGFSQAARDVVYPLVIERCFGRRYLAAIYGTMTVTLLPGAALGPLFAALLRDHFGNYQLAFVTYAGLNILAVVALLFTRDERVAVRP